MIDLAQLKERLERASAGLEGVTQRRMFGCDGFFAQGSIYALVWKEGRIGLRIPDEALFTALMSVEGAMPWQPGAVAMAHWVLLPVAMHEIALTRWTREAHAMAEAEGRDARQAPGAPTPRAEQPKAAARTSPRATVKESRAATPKESRAATPKAQAPTATKIVSSPVKRVR